MSTATAAVLPLATVRSKDRSRYPVGHLALHVPLYQLVHYFMSKLSACIFHWDSDDVAALR